MPIDKSDAGSGDKYFDQLLSLMQHTLVKAKQGDTRSKQIIHTYLSNSSIQQTIAMFAATKLGQMHWPVGMFDYNEELMLKVMEDHVDTMRKHTPADVLAAVNQLGLIFDKKRAADGVEKLVLRAA